MPFLEAFRQFQFRAKHENFCCVLVSLVPQVNNTKTIVVAPVIRDLIQSVMD